MLSKETLERYRRMTTSERAAIVVQLMRKNCSFWASVSSIFSTKRWLGDGAYFAFGSSAEMLTVKAIANKKSVTSSKTAFA